VATWGFPVEALEHVQTLADSDVRLVWLDGDREKARQVWINKTGKPDTDFKNQVAAIDSRFTEIRALFRKGWVEILSTEGTWLSFEQILERLSIQPRFRSV